VPRRFLPTLVASFALALVCAGSAAAVSITFDGRVLRYREYHKESAGFGFALVPSKAPKYLRIGTYSTFLPPVQVGFGCERQAYADPNNLELLCPLGTVPIGRLRYRLSLGDSWDSIDVNMPSMRGVIYAGRESDAVYGGDRVYGGPGGDDWLEGRRVYGGAGNDVIWGPREASVLHGGPGNDEFGGSGRFFGGPGDDRLKENNNDADPAARDMMVGGRGDDRIQLDTDHRRDVIDLHGLGTDRVICDKPADRVDVLFIDRTDRLDPDCKNATVLYTARPRYPYP
jgi:hypothetical protein